MDSAARDRVQIIPAAEALSAFGRALPDRPSPTARLADTLALAATLGPRFGLATEWAGSTEDRIVAAELSDPQIERAVALRRARLDTRDQKVAATLWLQGYCQRMAAPPLACWVLHRRVPDVSAGNIALRFDAEGRPAFTSLIAPRGWAPPGDSVDDGDLASTHDLLPQIVRVLLEDHLLPLADRVRARYRLGAAITRGAIASQIGMALTTIDAQSGVWWEQVATDALDLLRLTSPQLDGLGRSGELVCVQGGGRTGITYRRGTCCLVYRAPNKDKCGGCPLRDDEDRAGVYADRLAARPASSCV